MREALGIPADLAGVVADLLARRPQPGARVLRVGQARDPGHAGDQRLPWCVQMTGGVEDLDAPMLLAAVAAAVKSTPVMPSPAIRLGTAGISSGAPATSWWARMRAASLAKALSTWAALRSFRWSTLPRRVLPSSAMVRGTSGVLAFNAHAWRRKAASRASRSSTRNRWRRVFTAGARRKRAPKTVFRRSRWRPMKVTIP